MGNKASTEGGKAVEDHQDNGFAAEESTEAGTSQEQQMSYYQMAKAGYQQLGKCFDDVILMI